MQYLDLTLPDVAANLALDEALLLEAEAGRGGEVLRTWEWPTPAVVLGSSCVLSADVDEAACTADSVPILRRASGGGTVLLGKGCLLFTLVLDMRRDRRLGEIRSSYEIILGKLCEALRDIAPGIAFAGTSDLAVDGRKASGNAQQRKRDFLLHHGTLLHAFDFSRVSRYLRQPERQPQYREGRDHISFMTNLSCSEGQLRLRLRESLEATTAISQWPTHLVEDLAAEKYCLKAWTHRR